MNIALDIDDTIANYTKLKVQYAQIYDKHKASGKGFQNFNFWVTKGMFDWTEEEKKVYEKQTVGNLYPYLKPEYGGLQLINTLKKDGHKIFLVTSRGVDGLSKKKSTVTWLKELDVRYDKLIMNQRDKSEVLLKNKIDVFIDDNINHCTKAAEKGIFTIQKSSFMLEHEKFDNYCQTWEEVYKQIQKKAKEKPLIERYPIILDTDVSNEIDDEFALAYLYSFEKAKIEAVTIAQHFGLKRGQFDMGNNIDNSYNKALEITKLIRPSLAKKIYKGDKSIKAFGEWEASDAVKQIIKICQKNEKVIFIAIGALTNLGHAIELEPSIADKIKLYMLGGEMGVNKLLPETNITGDVYSTKLVLEKVKDKTIFPVTSFANLVLSLEDIKPHVKNNEIMKLLYSDSERIFKLFDCKWKSMFDIVIPFYLSNPINFIESETGIKMNNTCVVFNNSKNRAFVPTSIMPDSVLKDMFKRLKKYEN